MRGMVIIDPEHYGKGMELVQCIVEKTQELLDVLSYAEMGERKHREYPEDEEDYYKKEFYGARGSMGGRRMPKGRYNY